MRRLERGVTMAQTAARVCAVLGALWANTARAQSGCLPDRQCRFKKPNILFVLDYSSSMVGLKTAPAYFPPGQTTTTRWLAELDAVREILHYDGGFFSDNARLALARFAHDPDVNTPGTTIASDISFPPITDGFAIDVPFDASAGGYLECRASGIEAELELLEMQPPPAIASDIDPRKIMLTWTRGALRSAHQLISKTRQAHQGEPAEETRTYEVVLMTDGDWTCPDMVGQACDEDPAPEAAALREDGVRVHVVAFGDATMQPSLNEVALQGGTQKSIDATSPKGIVDGVSSALDSIRNSVIVPQCTRGLPRLLVIMDGSSSMIEGSAPGQTKWDKARFALAGNPQAPQPSDPGYVQSVLERPVDVGGRQVAIEDVVHVGMVVFAGADSQTPIVGFGPCMRDNIAWAMDPATSCEPPGCSDPYAGYPIQWSFKDSARDHDPPFVRETRSFMPACNPTPGRNSCVGQTPNTFTGQGLEFAQRTIDEYKRSPAPFQLDERTPFVNLLITDGQTSTGSSDVGAALRRMAAAGIDTYVIGFGSASELDEAQLARYAQAGNTERPIIVDPNRQDGAQALADALTGVVTSLNLDACCVLQDCSANPEPLDPGAACGDAVMESGEVCDDGALNASTGHCGARCDGPYQVCGDGRTEGPEQCDDGNTRAGDGCSPVCLLEPLPGPDQAEDDGGLVVPPALNRPPVPRPAPRASAPAAQATVPGATAPSMAAASPASPRSKVSRRAAGCQSAGAGNASSLLSFGLAPWALLLRRRSARRHLG